jgi:hypothetical protein
MTIQIKLKIIDKIDKTLDFTFFPPVINLSDGKNLFFLMELELDEY